jgi:hypothetical protein
MNAPAVFPNIALVYTFLSSRELVGRQTLSSHTHWAIADHRLFAPRLEIRTAGSTQAHQRTCTANRTGLHCGALTSNCHVRVGAILGRGTGQSHRPLIVGPHRMLEQVREIIVRSSIEDDVPAMIAIYTHHIQRGLAL